MALDFQRARKPEERELRREAILAAAASLFDEEGPQGTGLNAIAARAGFTKSNVYRYFESREEVLLNLFLDELDMFALALEERFGGLVPGDLPAAAQAAAAGFIARPRFCRLLSMLSAVLEQNVSETVIVAVKRASHAAARRIAIAMQRTLPTATLEDCAWAGSMVATLVAGMWPAAHPAPAAARVLAMPEFAALKPTLERDLERAALALLSSIERR